MFWNEGYPVGWFSPVGFVNPVGLINVEIWKLSRSTNLVLNFPAILNLSNIFQTPNHTSLQETENEMLKKQIEEMAKRAEQMAYENDNYRQRCSNLEELNKKKA